VIRTAVTSAALGALLLAGSVHATLTPNVRGTVASTATATKTPTGCFVDEPCDPPIGAVSTYVAFSRVGHAAVRARVVDGAFALHLAPGTYAIALTPLAGNVSPATVRVPRIGLVRLHLKVQPTP
jgi:hypothetical protein